MKMISFVSLLFVFPALAVPIWGDDIKEADYPVHYEILTTSKSSKRMIQKVCSMTLRDQTNTNVTFNVSKSGIGSCNVLEMGKIYNGRQNQKKDEIELVIPVGADRAKIENWHIDAAINIKPRIEELGRS